MLMGTETVLEADRVSKIYSRKRQVTQRRMGAALADAFLGRRYRPSNEELRTDEFFAVKDVSFSLKRGEALGIIGLNGSGKTTLLRMLAGQLLPDRGQITVMGDTASMIDLTAGFLPSASGRDNIFLRGAALGRSRAQMQADFKEIVAFSELGDAIEAPVASYSSGMMMRLAFSIISTSAPDLLFIDEVLAVGDFRFKQKCLARVRGIRERSSFVMVSHNMSDVARFCDQVIVLSSGDVVFFGEPEAAIDYFESEVEQSHVPVAEQRLRKVVGPQFTQSDVISDISHYWASEDGTAITEFSAGQPARFICEFTLKEKLRQLSLGVPLYSDDGVYVTGFTTRLEKPGGLDHRVGRNRFELIVPELHLNPGTWHSNVVIRDGVEHLYRVLNKPINIASDHFEHFGYVSLRHHWQAQISQAELGNA